MSIAGTVAGVPIRTGKKEGGWQLSLSYVPGDKADVIIAEKALEFFVENTLKDPQNVIEAAKLMGYLDYAALKGKVSRALLDPSWHMRMNVTEESAASMEEWVTREWTAENPFTDEEEGS